MRTTVCCVVLALYVIACTQAPKPVDVGPRVAPPAAIAITIDAALRERLAIGLPVAIELRTRDEPVGRCTLVFDLWEEHYRVAVSKTHVVHARDADAAARMCVDRDAVARLVRDERAATIEVREVPSETPRFDRARYDEF